jgi:opacity protein-like surface antigen
MHKQISLLLTIMLFSVATVRAQDVVAPEKKPAVKKPSQDHIMIQLTYDNWLNTPDTVNITGAGHGINVYLCYDFPIKKSSFSFGAGIGIGTSSLYLKDQQLILSDTGTGALAQFIPETKDYKNYKMATTYLEAPFELRYFSRKDNRNTGFKAAIGFRVGTMLSAHTKGRYTVDGAKVIDKEITRRFYETWRYAATLRLGWGNFTLMGAYNLGGVFKDGKGPEVTPYSVGLCITGL